MSNKSEIKSKKKTENTANAEKKKFNKKKWREEKYSLKAKVKRWQEKRERTLMFKYQKELKKSGVKIDSKQFQTKKKSTNPFKRAELEYKRIQEEKQKRKEERERIIKERNEALLAYKERKAARFKKLSQKTSKGQPLMKGRIELLLEKIEKEYAHHNS